MDFKIIKKDKNTLHNREDITFTISNTGATPTRREVKDLIVAKTSSKADTIAIISIKSEFGKNNAKGTAHIYKSKEDLEQKEPKHIIKRNTPKPVKEEKKEEKHVTNVEAKE